MIRLLSLLVALLFLGCGGSGRATGPHDDQSIDGDNSVTLLNDPNHFYYAINAYNSHRYDSVDVVFSYPQIKYAITAANIPSNSPAISIRIYGKNRRLLFSDDVNVSGNNVTGSTVALSEVPETVVIDPEHCSGTYLIDIASYAAR